jgi:hypothetical protein
MKKIIIISLILLAIFLSSGQAFAWHRGHFGIFVAPPRLWVGPPVFYSPGYYPPPSYYGPGYYYSSPYRVWVPGYREGRWTPYGRERAWIPGYWEYRR